MKRFCFSFIGLILAISFLFNLVGCTIEEATDTQVQDLTAGVYQHLVEPLTREEMYPYHSAINRFAMELFQKSNVANENSLISPLSVLYALAMTANGAGGETLKQMEDVLGISTEELNRYLYSYTDAFPNESSENRTKIEIANSIWVNQEAEFVPNKEFLQINADYYGAGIYGLPFDEKATKFMNDWVREKTNDMIPKLVDQIDKNTVAVLLNALVFDCHWDVTYEEENVKIGEFTKEDQTKQTAEFMYQNILHGTYYENEKFTGFSRGFDGFGHRFIALLPKEGVTVSEALADLDGDAFMELLDNGEGAIIDTAVPKFETEFNANMCGVLKNMGIDKAFGEDADFCKMGTCSVGNLYIEEINHNAKIKVNEKGVVAGAGTSVQWTAVGGAPDEQRKVHLDRPFIYVLYDSINLVPLFIGTMMDVQK